MEVHSGCQQSHHQPYIFLLEFGQLRQQGMEVAQLAGIDVYNI